MLEVLSLDPVRFGCKLSPQKDRKAVTAGSFLHQTVISSCVVTVFVKERKTAAGSLSISCVS